MHCVEVFVVKYLFTLLMFLFFVLIRPPDPLLQSQYLVQLALYLAVPQLLLFLEDLKVSLLVLVFEGLVAVLHESHGSALGTRTAEVVGNRVGPWQRNVVHMFVNNWHFLFPVVKGVDLVGFVNDV